MPIATQIVLFCFLPGAQLWADEWNMLLSKKMIRKRTFNGSNRYVVFHEAFLSLDIYKLIEQRGKNMREFGRFNISRAVFFYEAYFPILIRWKNGSN